MIAFKSLLMVVLTLFGLHTFSSDEEVQVGRYSTMKLLPTEAQKNVFDSVVLIEFKPSVKTVGQAMRVLVEKQGHKLTVPKAEDTPVRTLIALPLPDVHRTLGPISLQHALETLAGPVWRLVHDPVHRLVTFELCMAEEAKEGENE